MIFDTETTGLIPKSKSISLEKCPYITQLSFVVYNTEKQLICSTFNTFIKIPYTIEIPQIVIDLTGITKQKCENGMNIESALGIFYHTMTLCDCIIGHNIDFDIQMMNIEIERNLQKLDIFPNIKNLFSEERLHSINTHLDCTMQMSIDICSIYRTTAKKYTYKKFPKLSETYFHLFQIVPENLHNSLIDTLICLRCYLKLKFDICIEDHTFNKLLEVTL
jgi:DNA polymerase III alpha subunit (gram-positive type)